MKSTLSSLACLLLPFAFYAQDGALDNSFNSSGTIATNIALANDDRAYAVVVQADGKIILAGTSGASSNNDVSLLRYNANGTIDNTFGSGGIVKTSVNSGYDIAYGMALQSDGKIVVAGYTNNGSNTDVAVLRYNPDGSLDNTFDGDGKVTTDVTSGYEIALGMAIQPDGKIVAAGYRRQTNNSSSPYTILVLRYNSDGSLDTGFDSDGIVTTAIGIKDDQAKAVAIQPDGKIVITGHTSITSTNYDFALLRYNTDGSLDNTFDSDGIVTTDFNGAYETSNALVLQPDGKIVAGGSSYVGSFKDFALARYNADGSPDGGFGGGGKLTTSMSGGSDECFALALQPDGKLVAGGGGFGSLDLDFMLARYNADGSLDNTFKNTGKITTSIGKDNQCYALAIQPDGKIVAGGYSYHTTTGGPTNFDSDDFAAARYQASSVFIGLNELAAEQNHLQAYPNPFNAGTSITSGTALNNGELKIYNLLGQQVQHIQNLQGSQVELNKGNLPAGVYLLQLMQEGKTIASTRLVVTE